MTDHNEKAVCQLCGEPMPPGEEMFNYHGYSGDCPKPPLPKQATPEETQAILGSEMPIPVKNVAEGMGIFANRHNEQRPPVPTAVVTTAPSQEDAGQGEKAGVAPTLKPVSFNQAVEILNAAAQDGRIEQGKPAPLVVPEPVAAAPTPRTDALFTAYEVDKDGVTLRDGVAALERELAAAKEKCIAHECAIALIRDTLNYERDRNLQKVKSAREELADLQHRIEEAAGELPEELETSVTDIDDEYLKALEFKCLCGTPEITCPHCGQWERARNSVKHLFSYTDALRTQFTALLVKSKEDADAAQARIDELMLEHCPDEMTPKQVENWGKHQRTESALDAKEGKV